MSWNVIDANKVRKDGNVTVLLDYTTPYSELRYGVGEGCTIYQAEDQSGLEPWSEYLDMALVILWFYTWG